MGVKVKEETRQVLTLTDINVNFGKVGGVLMLDSTRAYLRDCLYYYKSDKQEIAAFREAAYYPIREVDENIGGGRSSFISKPTEAIAMKLASPSQLEEKAKSVETIDHLFGLCDDETFKELNAEHKDVIMAKYINGRKEKKVSVIAHETKLSESTVKRRDKEFLNVMRLYQGRR